MLTRRAFSWYLAILTGIGVLILISTYLYLRPYLTHLSIFQLEYSNNQLITPILPTITSLTPTSVIITFSHSNKNSILTLGTSPTQLTTTYPLTTTTLTIPHLTPRTHYYFQIDNSPVYSFTTPRDQ